MVISHQYWTLFTWYKQVNNGKRYLNFIEQWEQLCKSFWKLSCVYDGGYMYKSISVCHKSMYTSDISKHLNASASSLIPTGESGLRVNIKAVSPRNGDSHAKDKTVARPFYPYHGDPYTGKTTCLYWDSSQVRGGGGGGHVTIRLAIYRNSREGVPSTTTVVRECDLLQLLGSSPEKSARICTALHSVVLPRCGHCSVKYST